MKIKYEDLRNTEALLAKIEDSHKIDKLHKDILRYVIGQLLENVPRLEVWRRPVGITFNDLDGGVYLQFKIKCLNFVHLRQFLRDTFVDCVVEYGSGFRGLMPFTFAPKEGVCSADRELDPPSTTWPLPKILPRRQQIPKAVVT